MFHALGLDPATEHQVRHERLTTVHDRKSHYAIGAEPILYFQDISIEMRIGENLLEYRTVVSVSREIHLIRALSQLMNPLKVLLNHGPDAESDLTVAQEGHVIVGEIASHGLSLRFDLVHLAAVPALRS